MDIDKIMNEMESDMVRPNINKFRGFMERLFSLKLLERGRKSVKLQAKHLLMRLILYKDCWELVHTIDLDNDFHIHHAVMNVHIWLLY